MGAGRQKSAPPPFVFSDPVIRSERVEPRLPQLGLQARRRFRRRRQWRRGFGDLRARDRWIRSAGRRASHRRWRLLRGAPGLQAKARKGGAPNESRPAATRLGVGVGTVGSNERRLHPRKPSRGPRSRTKNCTKEPNCRRLATSEAPERGQDAGSGPGRWDTIAAPQPSSPTTHPAARAPTRQTQKSRDRCSCDRIVKPRGVPVAKDAPY